MISAKEKALTQITKLTQALGRIPSRQECWENGISDYGIRRIGGLVKIQELLKDIKPTGISLELPSDSIDMRSIIKKTLGMKK